MFTMIAMKQCSISSKPIRTQKKKKKIRRETPHKCMLIGLLVTTGSCQMSSGTTRAINIAINFAITDYGAQQITVL